MVVNTYTDSTQRDPYIARDAEGNYVVVWYSINQVTDSSEGDIFLQRFSKTDAPIGGETLVNTETATNQEKPSLAMNGNGNFVIAWQSWTDMNSIYDVKARLYKNGTPTSDEFLVNTTSLNSQCNPDVDIHNSGEFIVAWESWYQDGSQRGVYAQRFDSNGVKIGSEFLVNTTTLYGQSRPVVKYFDNGKFIIIWESWKQDIVTPSGYGLFGKIYNADGSVAVNEFQINTTTNDFQWLGDVITLDDNNFIVVWCSWEQDGDDGGIYMNKFDSLGNKLLNETLVNKSIAYYQWLPRITKMPNGNIAIAWSSWKQYSDREDVFVRIFSQNLEPISLEDRVNEFSSGYQWEPDIIANDHNELVLVYSSYAIVGKDYDIAIRIMQPRVEQGVIHWNTYDHTAGITTSRFFVHVIDTTQLTGDTYEITFKTPKADSILATIQNLNTTNYMVTDFPIDKGKNVFYLTETFEGVAIEFIPEFTLALDLVNSRFINHSGTNVIFSTQKPSGQVLYYPMDCGIIWANCDTLPGGLWANVLDSAYSGSMTRDIKCPFTIRNLTNDTQLRFYISEKTPANKQWDPGENIIILNPNSVIPSYIRFHAQVNTTKPAGTVLFPMAGDTNLILTTRPLDSNDVFQFQTIKGNMTTKVVDKNHIPDEFRLEQNYPNPFNPNTTIQFTIPAENFVKLNVYNILGQKVKTLVNEKIKQGTHKVLFNGYSDNGTLLASGIYLYVLEFDKQVIAKKMIMLK